MATITTKTHVCDRCGRKQEGQVGLDFDGGYLSMGPINGALSDHVGRRRNDEDHNAEQKGHDPCVSFHVGSLEAITGHERHHDGTADQAEDPEHITHRSQPPRL